MPDSSVGDNRKTDRHLVEYDDKERALDLSGMNIIPPAVGIFDEPTRCYKLNHEWSKIVIGIVSWLAATPVWAEAENEGYFAIEEILHFMKQTETCMDCDDIENCLELSPIITLIEITLINNTINITNNTTNVTNNTIEITNILEQPSDGSTYPDPPDVEEEPDRTCGSAYRCVLGIRDWITTVEGLPVSYPTIQDALEALLIGEISLAYAIAVILIENAFIVPPPPSILPDFIAQEDDMREWLYCNGFNKALFATWVEENLTLGLAIAEYIRGVAFVQWEHFILAGSYDETQDCSSYCTNNDPAIVVPCYGGGAGGTIEFVSGIRWRATATLRSGNNRAITLGSEDGNCFTLSNVVVVGQGNPGWYGFKHCDDFCNAEASHSPTHAAHKEFGWTDNSSVFTVEFDYVPGS